LEGDDAFAEDLDIFDEEALFRSVDVSSIDFLDCKQQVPQQGSIGGGMAYWVQHDMPQK
jgi:hypothetical protein